jgi:hypothetical protein
MSRFGVLLKKSDDGRERILGQLRHEFPGGLVDLLGVDPETENAYCPWFWFVAPVLISRTGYGRRTRTRRGWC